MNAKLKEIRKLAADGLYDQVIWKLENLEGFPAEMYELAADACARAILECPIALDDALFLAFYKMKIPPHSAEGERILQALLSVASHFDSIDRKTAIMALDVYVDPRVFDALVAFYRRTERLDVKREVAYVLGKQGWKEALPVLLDYHFLAVQSHTPEAAELLARYAIPDAPGHFPVDMAAEDADCTIRILLEYLDETEGYVQDNHNTYDTWLRINAARILAILYPSENTPSQAKARLRQNQHRRIDCYCVDYMYDSFGHDHLSDYVQFQE